MKMQKIVAIVSVVLTLTGYGMSGGVSTEGVEAGAASAAAEKFAKAIIQRELDEAIAAYDLYDMKKWAISKANVRSLKEDFEELGKTINDSRLKVKSIREDIRGGMAYRIVNGRKYTAHAEVVVQFFKGRDKKSQGMEVELVLVDGAWKVSHYKYIPDGLDTSDEEEEEAVKEEPKSSRHFSQPAAEELPMKKEFPAKVDDRPVKKESPAKVARPVKKAYGSREQEFESLVREAAEVARQDGEKVSERDIQEEIEAFKKLSIAEQDEKLKAVRELMKMMRGAKKTW